ncbi:DUF192 domain-containing protein [Roseimaritima ulvae]|uniref:DUF192 domain-containing protein n=1 Tax=Roseimaritima ulvae TaxID=980254 RepID=A0A5B9QUW4_9BACT|nr:DUF192 domain-containing protein [Roseimaritima ulvae]QEG40856.1 hypothetical protein UC8_28740 [Roseimaritima ulvae]
MRTRRSSSTLQWLAADERRVLADSVRVADSFWKRLIGLQFAASLPGGQVLWLRDCRSVHTAWMRFAIDVYFLDATFRIVDARRNVPPWRIVRPRSPHARHVVEARSLEAAERLTVGLQTVFEACREDTP